MAIGSLLIPFLVLIPGTALLALLQWLLCRLDSPWPGRILPLCSGAFSLLVVVPLILYIAPGAGAGVFVLSLLLLAALNIPTAVYLIIYRTVRRGKVRRQDMDRMNIQDL